MECKEHYPDDFKAALRRTPIKNGEIETLCASSSARPIFVYGQLMLPTILKYFAGVPETGPADQKLDMIPAKLPEHKLHHFTKHGEPGLPVMTTSEYRSDKVQGMLVFGLRKEQHRDLLQLECGCSDQNMPVNLKVQVPFGGKAHGYDVHFWKSVEATALVWRTGTREMSGLSPMETTYWPIDDFIAGQLYANIVEQVERQERLRYDMA
ncbi:hypothetical protein BDV06DRAFT_92810 [Aspergillus oleicola]